MAATATEPVLPEEEGVVPVTLDGSRAASANCAHNVRVLTSAEATMVEQAIQMLRANLPRGILLRAKWIELLAVISPAGFTRLCAEPRTLLHEDEAASPFEKMDWFDLEAIVQRLIYALTLLSIDEAICEALDLTNSEWMRARTNHSLVRVPYWRIAGAMYAHNVMVYRAGTDEPSRIVHARDTLRPALGVMTEGQQERWAKQITHPGLALTPFVFPHGLNGGKALTGHLLEQLLLGGNL